MLKSKFAKDVNEFKAQRIFTDRIEPRAVFSDSIASFIAESKDYKPSEIIVYYGKGGIGKTALLKKLKSEESSVFEKYPQYSFKSIYISLDAFDYSNPVNILLAIRDKIDGDCSLFDYAMLQYSAKAKFTINEIMDKHSLLSSPVVEILNEVVQLGTLSACIPVSTIKKAVKLFKDNAFKQKHKADIEEMDSLSESELFERLPYYLGLCISHAAENKKLHVIYLDSYESLISRTDTIFYTAADEWLKELFISSEKVRFVIASRDKIQWEYQEPEWKDYMNQHLLKNLSPDDSRWFLRSVPITDSDTIDAIVQNSEGVPLYLDMCVNMFETDSNEHKSFILDNESCGERIIDRYTRYLSEKEKGAIRVLSFLGSFETDFARDYLQRQGITYEVGELETFMNKSIFIPLDEKRTVYSIDKSVRTHQASLLSNKRIADILNCIIEMLIDNPKGKNFLYLDSVLDTVKQKPEIAEMIVDKLCYVIELYGTAGYWNELHSRLANYIDNGNTYLRAIAVYAEIIYLRRQGILKEEQAFIETHVLDEKQIGLSYYMYRYFVIQNIHLQGHYDEAMNQYKDLITRMNLIKQIIPIHTYTTVCMKYADLMFLKGDFNNSLKYVEELLSEPNISTADILELMRIKGHIARFNQKYSDAEIIYTAALKIAEDNGLTSFKGKLYVNLAETLCATNPQKALEWFTLAKDANEELENGIELCKAFTAASVAYTNLDNTIESIRYANKAIELADSTGYRSGKAFALIALYYAYTKNNDYQSRKQTYNKLGALIKELGVYSFLLDRITAYETTCHD